MTPTSIPGHVVIVGAGPAGLAVAALLTRARVPYTLLDKADSVGSAWRSHYDRLRLHTPRWRSHLPELDMPRSYPRYPSRQQVVEYLDGYARYFNIQPRLNEKVTRARREGQRWHVSTDKGEYTGRALVVASGYNEIPVSPEWPGKNKFSGTIMHSSAYRNGSAFKGKRVLVVGLGNSGGEIAIDLHEHGARPTLAVRSPVNVIPREILGFSYLDLGIAQQHLPAKLADTLNNAASTLLLGDLTRYGLKKPAIGPVAQVRQTGHVPLIDVGTVKLVKSGDIQIRPGIQHFTPSGVQFTDGRQEDFDAVVLATGFTPGVKTWLEAPETVLNNLKQHSGKPTPERGLYFCGYYVSPTGMLREIGREAHRIVQDIGQRA